MSCFVHRKNNNCDYYLRLRCGHRSHSLTRLRLQATRQVFLTEWLPKLKDFAIDCFNLLLISSIFLDPISKFLSTSGVTYLIVCYFL